MTDATPTVGNLTAFVAGGGVVTFGALMSLAINGDPLPGALPTAGAGVLLGEVLL